MSANLIELSQDELYEREKNIFIKQLINDCDGNFDETTFTKVATDYLKCLDIKSNYFKSTFPNLSLSFFDDIDNIISLAFKKRQQLDGAFFTELPFVELFYNQYCTIDILSHLEHGGYIFDPCCGTANLFKTEPMFQKYQSQLILNDISNLSLDICKKTFPNAHYFNEDIFIEVNKQKTGETSNLFNFLKNKFVIVITNPIYLSYLTVWNKWHSNPEDKAFSQTKNWFKKYIKTNNENFYNIIGEGSKKSTEHYLCAALVDILKPSSMIYIVPKSTLEIKPPYYKTGLYLINNDYGYSENLLSINNKDFFNCTINREIVFFEIIKNSTYTKINTTYTSNYELVQPKVHKTKQLF